jgi:hypothetical protein
MRARKAAKQIKRSYRDPFYTVRNYQKCADTLVSRTRSHFRRLARYYHRIGTLHNCISELNLSNYYWHESATMYIWETVEEMWLFNSQKQKRKKIKQEESEIPEYI